MQCELRPDDIVRIGKTSFKLVVEVLPAAQPLPPRVVSNAAIRNQWRLTKEERDEQAQRKVFSFVFACHLSLASAEAVCRSGSGAARGTR